MSLLYTLGHKARRVRQTEAKLLCSLYLMGCHKVIRDILSKFNVTREWLHRHFRDKEEENGLPSFQVNLFKFLQHLKPDEATRFFQSFGDDGATLPDENEPYEISLLRLMEPNCQPGLVKPKTDLGPERTSFLGPNARKYLDKATSSDNESREVRHGAGLIINQRDFEDDEGKTRHGTNRDVSNLKETWAKKGCEMTEEKNLTEEGVYNAVDRFARHVNKDDSYDYLVMVILSHGQFNASTNSSEFFDINMKPIGLDGPTGVINRLMNRCVSMQQKPKLFIVQACRDSDDQPIDPTEVGRDAEPASRSWDACHQRFSNSYWILIHSSIKNSYAYLNRQSGSLLVSSLCQVLNEKGSSKSVLDCFNDAKIKIWNQAKSNGLRQNAELTCTMPVNVFLKDNS